MKQVKVTVPALIMDSGLVPVELKYSPEENPLEVFITLGPGWERSLSFSFDRMLIVRPGTGRMPTCTVTTEYDEGDLMTVRMQNSQGESLFVFKQDHLDDFVVAMLELRPEGEETVTVDWDRWLEQLGD